MHHRIWLLVIVITSTYPAATPQPTIRMCLLFYVKIIEKNSVYTDLNWILMRIQKYFGLIVYLLLWCHIPIQIEPQRMHDLNVLGS